MFRLAAVMFLILMANQSLAQEIPKQSPAPMSKGFTMFIGVPCDNRNILKIITASIMKGHLQKEQEQ